MVTAALDRAWAAALCASCDPVFEAADVGFTRNQPREPMDNVNAFLWEADPARFVERYPESGIIESYGEQWPDVGCIDYWVYVDRDSRRATFSVEGWDDRDLSIDLTGDGHADGRAIAEVFAHILRTM